MMNESETYIQNILHPAEQMSSEPLTSNCNDHISVNAEKSSAVWTYSATLTLLKLYENKLGMLESPKKKTRIWKAVSESLKKYNIEVTADQVKWKINALTKKYKQCVDAGQPTKFKYYRQMNNIYTKYNMDSDAFALGKFIYKKKNCAQVDISNLPLPTLVKAESKTMIELRKVRLANRIESDRNQSKLNLEKQWIEYLERQEQDRIVEDEIFDRKLKLREEELVLCRQELESKESMELRNVNLIEREQDELLKIEKEKCEMLKHFFGNKY